MSDFLVRHFIKDYKRTERASVRAAYGTLSGTAGILCNILLFLAKGSAAILLRSVSVMADAFNNLSDAGASVVSLIGMRVAGIPADERHPFGHGRMEYVTALVVAFLVLQVGFAFFKESVSKILRPEALRFKGPAMIVLLLSVGVKLWLGRFNKKLGERIDSKVMLAAAADAAGDVITTSATIASIFVFYLTGKNIDGIVGLGVSLAVMWAGLGIVRDTLEPLIGEAGDPKEYERISGFVESYEGVVGSHDLIVHKYGPGRSMATIHAEVPNDVSIEKSHEIIDRIEREALRKLGVFLVIHMDPVEMKNESVVRTRAVAEGLVRELDENVSIHDFRMVRGEDRINLIFDMLIPRHYSKERVNALCRALRERLCGEDERYRCVITVESGYVSQKKKRKEMENKGENSWN